jgi:dethiobiotin synthase
MRQALFVIGTERRTGVTTVASGLAAALQRRGLRVGVMTPVAVGCPLAPSETPVAVGGVPGEQDAESVAALARLAALAGPPPATLVGATPPEALDPVAARRLLQVIGVPDPSEDQLARVCPYRFAADLEPAAAARAAETTIELETLRRAFTRVAEAKDIMVVDGSTGLMSPLNDEHLMVDLVQELGLTVVLVAPSRTWSVLSPCLLALSALASRGIPLAGVVLNRTDRELSPEEAVNPYQLELHAGAVVRGILPHLTPEQLEDTEQLARRVEVHLDVGALVD